MTNPVDLETVKTVLTSANALALLKGSPAHDSGLCLVNEMLRHNQDPDWHQGVIQNLLPETYSGNLLKEVRGMVQSGIEKGIHLNSQSETTSDAKQSELIIDAVQNGEMRLFCSPLREVFMSIPGKKGGRMTVALRGSGGQEYLRRSYFSKHRKPPAAAAMKEALDHFEAIAHLDEDVEDVYVRVASKGGANFYDIGDETYRVIKVTRSDWKIVEEAPVNFIRPNGTVKALPTPELGFQRAEFQNLLNMDDQNFVLFTAFCVSSLNADGPYFTLHLHGQQGSGKSNIGKLAKDMIDPNVADKLRLPKSEQDLVLQVQAQWVLNYDNASYVSNEMSDMFCMVATGGSFATRRLYTDNEQIVFVFMRPVILNGIGNYAKRPDLQERSIPLNLKAIPPGKRRTERELARELDVIKPKYLGFLLDCVVHGLANLEKVEPPRSVRMADAAHWLVAAEGAMGFEDGVILEALENVQRELMAQTAVDDSLTVGLLNLLIKQPDNRFEGRYGQLHDLLLADSQRHGRGLPASPAALSNKLKRMRPGLRQIGLVVEDGPRSSSGQTVILCLTKEGLVLAREIGGHDDGSRGF